MLWVAERRCAELAIPTRLARSGYAAPPLLRATQLTASTRAHGITGVVPAPRRSASATARVVTFRWVWLALARSLDRRIDTSTRVRSWWNATTPSRETRRRRSLCCSWPRRATSARSGTGSDTASSCARSSRVATRAGSCPWTLDAAADVDALLREIRESGGGPVPMLGRLYAAAWKQECEMGAQMQSLIGRHPAWSWLRGVRGVGSVLAARLLVATRPDARAVAGVVLGLLRARHRGGRRARVRAVRRAGVRVAGHARRRGAYAAWLVAGRCTGTLRPRGVAGRRARRAGASAARRARAVRHGSEDDLLSDRRVVRAVRRTVSRGVRRTEGASRRRRIPSGRPSACTSPRCGRR